VPAPEPAAAPVAAAEPPAAPKAAKEESVAQKVDLYQAYVDISPTGGESGSARPAPPPAPAPAPPAPAIPSEKPKPLIAADAVTDVNTNLGVETKELETDQDEDMNDGMPGALEEEAAGVQSDGGIIRPRIRGKDIPAGNEPTELVLDYSANVAQSRIISGLQMEMRDGTWFQQGYAGESATIIRRNSLEHKKLEHRNPALRIAMTTGKMSVLKIHDRWYLFVSSKHRFADPAKK